MPTVPNIDKPLQQPSSQQASDVTAGHAIAPEMDAAGVPLHTNTT